LRFFYQYPGALHLKDQPQRGEILIVYKFIDRLIEVQSTEIFFHAMAFMVFQRPNQATLSLIRIWFSGCDIGLPGGGKI